MNEDKKSGMSAWLYGFFGLLAGVFIGLVLLGWWLWPVQWVNGSYEILSPALQDDFLRAAIDSYSLRPDGELATQRYEGLGENGPYVLGQISTNPGDLSPDEINGFAGAVGATDAIENPPAEPAAPMTPALPRGRTITQPLIAGVCVILLLILLALFILFIVSRRNKKKVAPVEPTGTPPPAEIEATPIEGAVVVAAAEKTSEVPDWLQEPTEGEEPAETVELGEQAEGTSGTVEEAEASLSDQDIEEITSSNLGGAAEEDQGTGFLGDVLPTAAVAGAGVIAAAAIAGKEDEGEIEGEPSVDVEADHSMTADTLVAGAVAATASQAVEPVEEAAGLEKAEESVEIVESQEEVHAKFGQDIESVMGIGPVYGAKLREAGITAPLLLLRNGATSKGRQQIANNTEISEKMILKWVNYVDLYRIKGVSEAYAELLEASGVDTVPELATRNPKNLHTKILSVIEEKRIFREPPTSEMVESWVEQAKKLPRAIQY
jgi:predicted flap endonuclease-1-like 5' DNA nuclease